MGQQLHLDRGGDHEANQASGDFGRGKACRLTSVIVGRCNLDDIAANNLKANKSVQDRQQLA